MHLYTIHTDFRYFPTETSMLNKEYLFYTLVKIKIKLVVSKFSIRIKG